MCGTDVCLIARAADGQGGLMTTDFDQVDFFTDASLLEDPYPYFEHLRVEVPGDAARRITACVAVSG